MPGLLRQPTSIRHRVPNTDTGHRMPVRLVDAPAGSICARCSARTAPPSHACEECRIHTLDRVSPRCDSEPVDEELELAAGHFVFPDRNGLSKTTHSRLDRRARPPGDGLSWRGIESARLQGSPFPVRDRRCAGGRADAGTAASSTWRRASSSFSRCRASVRRRSSSARCQAASARRLSASAWRTAFSAESSSSSASR